MLYVIASDAFAFSEKYRGVNPKFTEKIEGVNLNFRQKNQGADLFQSLRKSA